MSRARAAALALAVAAITAGCRSGASVEDLTDLALRSERAAAETAAPSRREVRAGPGASVDRLLAASPSRRDALGGLALAAGEVFVADAAGVARLVDGSLAPLAAIPAGAARVDAPLALAASPGGALYAIAPERGELLRVDLRTRTMARVAGGLAHPSAAVALAGGAVAVVEAGAGRLTQVEPDGRLAAVAGNLSSPLALAHHAGRFFVSELSGGRILALAPGRPPVPVAGGFPAALGIAVDRAGRLVVADGTTGGVYRVETDASRTELATGLDLGRTVDGLPVAVAMAVEESGALLVVAPGDGALWRITPP